VKRLLRSYYLYQATANSVFFAPVFYLYYEDRVGLSLATILWLESYFTALRAILDLPFGALADRYSRRACLLVSALCLMAGSSVIVLWPRFAVAVIAETLFACASALRSGADSALLFDALQAAGRIEHYPRAESRGQAVLALAAGATAIVGGLLAARDLSLPFVATALAALVSLAVAWRLGDDRRGGAHTPSARRLLVDAARATRLPGVRWVLGLAVFAVVASHAYFFLQQPYLRAAGVPVALFGVVFAATKVVTAIVANAAHRVDARLGRRGVTALMTAAAGSGLMAMGALVSPMGALFVLVRGVLDGLWQPLLNVYMNRLVDSRLRATMLSLQSLAARLALATFIALLGLGTATAGLRATLAAAGVAATVAGGALALGGARLPTRSRVIARDG
jgi:predicted MFS family arabinose efflux permease